MTPETAAPPMMRAAVYDRFGEAEVVHLEEVARPVPRPDEILIRVHASTVSTADYRARTRDVPRGLRLPASLTIGFRRPRRPILGMDVAGVVAAAGADVARFRVGDEVIAMLGSAFGGHAEYATVRETAAIAPKPVGMSFEEAVTLVFGGITARAFLRQARVNVGSEVLVNGASGAVGTAAIQLAKVAGARVTAVCSSGSASLVSSLGADEIVDYHATDFARDPRTYDVIVDCVGNAPFNRVERSLVPGGALLLVVTDLAGVLLAPVRARLRGRRVITSPGDYRAEGLAYLVGLADAGGYRPVIDRIYPLEEIADAHRYVADGHKKGNVVLRIPEPLEPRRSRAQEGDVQAG